MRQPRWFLSLDDVPLVDGECDECHGEGLCCPDDPLDKLTDYVLDDDFLFEALEIDCSPPRETPAPMCPAAPIDDGVVDMDVDDLSGGASEFSRTVPGGGGPGTCVALGAGRLVPEKNVPPLTVEGLSLSQPWEAQSPEPGLPFNPSTVPRRRRGEPATVRKQPWRLALPPVLRAAAPHGNRAREFSGGNGGGGHRRSAGRRRNRQVHRTCRHCLTSETPQWRTGPDGAGTLCNACGIRYKLDRKLVPEYRPSMSPFYSSDEHSNRHRKVEKLTREKKERILEVDGA